MNTSRPRLLWSVPLFVLVLVLTAPWALVSAAIDYCHSYRAVWDAVVLGKEGVLQ